MRPLLSSCVSQPALAELLLLLRPPGIPAMLLAAGLDWLLPTRGVLLHTTAPPPSLTTSRPPLSSA